jgi:hypothetical protein
MACFTMPNLDTSVAEESIYERWTRRNVAIRLTDDVPSPLVVQKALDRIFIRRSHDDTPQSIALAVDDELFLRSEHHELDVRKPRSRGRS